MKILKCLVIEDDDVLREALRGALREALRELEREAVIFEASDPGEATRIVKQGPHIDLIVLDLELPILTSLCSIWSSPTRTVLNS
jgi:CheY-like chemotaxis protein